MHRFALNVVVALMLVAVASSACRNKTLQPTDTSLVFSYSPIAPADIEFITPLGNLNPPEHTLPTDHVYFYHHLNLNHRSLPQFEVVAPAGGVVQHIQRSSDDAIMVKVTNRLSYKLGHVLLDGGISENTRVTAGQRLGTTSPEAAALDLWVMNLDIAIGFITPGRYPSESINCDKPLKYFSDDLRAPLYAKVTGVNADKDGRIDYDQPGRLVGNWFHESLTVAESPNRESGPRHLSFARDVNDWSKIRISIGGTIAEAGTYSVAAGDPDPANVSVASGAVTFKIQGGNTGATSGVLTVQMLADAKIRVDFGGGSNVYVR